MSPPPAASVPTPVAASVPQATVLVVDDIAVNRFVLARYVAQMGHETVEAEDGQRALELLETRPFDLVLLDVLMPVLDGYAVLAILKADRRLRDIPVIVVSAVEETDSVVQCIEGGAEDHLAKPFNPVLLRARINASLEKKRYRDQELEYLRAVASMTSAAAALESGSFDPDTLSPVAARTDRLGNMARVFLEMAREMQARHRRLEQRLIDMQVEIDEIRKWNEVSEITESEYFQKLHGMAAAIRQRMVRGDG
jgi:CheY-like chemotaxis protein